MGLYMGHMRQRMGWLWGQLNPLIATLPPCPVVMVSLHESQGLVRWVLMEAQARLLDFSTILVMAITPALMATRAINASALLVFSPCGKFYMGHLGPKLNIIMLILLQDLTCSTRISASLLLYAAMPRERGKPQWGSTYYSRFGWHNCQGPASQAPTPSGDHLGSLGQNLSSQAPTEPWPPTTEGLYGTHYSPRHASRDLIPDGDHSSSSRKNWFA